MDLLSGSLVRAYRRDMHIDQARRSDLAASMFYDVLWDGPVKAPAFVADAAS